MAHPWMTAMDPPSLWFNLACKETTNQDEAVRANCKVWRGMGVGMHGGGGVVAVVVDGRRQWKGEV